MTHANAHAAQTAAQTTTWTTLIVVVCFLLLLQSSCFSICLFGMNRKNEIESNTEQQINKQNNPTHSSSNITKYICSNGHQ